MSLLMYAPLSDSAVPMPVDFDFDFEDLDFRTLSEAPPAEALEPSLSAAVQLPASLANMSGEDIWKELSTESRPSSSTSPRPRSVMDYMDDSDVVVKLEEDFFAWSALLDSKQLRNDCMWSSESAEVPVAAKSVAGTSAAAVATAAAPSATVVKEVATVPAAKCEPSVVAVKCEPVDSEDTVVAVSCGPVVTTVAGASANTMRTGARAQTSLLNKSEVSLLKSNNRSLLISSRTGVVSTSSNPIPSSPVKNNVLPERSERVKVQPSVMWGPYSSSAAGPATATCFQSSSLESDGDSPRPYTPPSQSESEDDDDHPRFKHSFDMVLGLESELFEDVDSSSSVASGSSLDAVSVFCDTVNCDLDLDDEAYVASLAEAAEQMCRPSVTSHATDSGRAKSNSRKSESASRREEIESSRHAFMSDHSYHLSKGAVKTEHLGVQTPSDSEEEIDVVSVGEKHCARTSAVSATALPTNPSARDRQQLQLTVASAITAKHHGGAGRGGRAAGEGPARGRIPVRITLGDRTVGVRSVPQAMVVDPAYDVAGASDDGQAGAGPTRSGPGRKRGGSGAGAGRCGTAKRPRVQYQHRLQHHAPRGRGRRPRGGDDSEPDPTEKRSLHNDMERQRRIDLRNLVDDLRKLVPDLKDNKRAAKVMILREAAKYCRSLRDEGRSLLAETAALRRQQDRIMARLSTLRRDLAASRL